MIRTIIIDDEKQSRDVLIRCLADTCREVEVVATAASLKQSISVIRQYAPNLIFLDVELGDGKGFDLFEEFKSPDFKVIFVTAFSEYAVRAFRYSAADYLLKPIQIHELHEAVERVKAMNGSVFSEKRLHVLLKSLSDSKDKFANLVIPNLKGFEVVKVADIILCKADGYCTNFYLTGSKKIVSSKNLKQYEILLTDKNFLRVHHSFIVNLDHVCSYSRQGEILMTENLKASLGDNYKEVFIKKFIGKQ